MVQNNYTCARAELSDDIRSVESESTVHTHRKDSLHGNVKSTVVQMIIDQIKIGKFIRERRLQQGLTQKQLADLINVGAGTISKWECGRGLPELVNILPLCEVLEISFEELIKGEFAD